MNVVPPEERSDFPRAGYRARRWLRFERDLRAWLATPDGRFASWRAERDVAGEQREPVRPGSSRTAP
jgi:hypothetical protein